MTAHVAIITGAASGIGKHWAEVLSKKIGEYQLVLADSNMEGLRSAFAPNEQIILRALDIRSAEQWQALIEETLKRFGRIDHLFNIAGANRPLFLRDQPLDAIDRVIDINLKGALIGMKLVGEVMLKQKAGHIVNVASLAGVSPTPGNALYSAAKASRVSLFGRHCWAAIKPS